MIRILVPVDGSEIALRAAAQALRVAETSKEPVELHLLNVQPPMVSGDVKMFVGREAVDSYYRDEGEKALASARALFDKSGADYRHHIGVGPIAETIVAYVKDQQCTQVVMGTRGLGAVAGLLLGSVATKVLQQVSIPVTLVS